MLCQNPPILQLLLCVCYVTSPIVLSHLLLLVQSLSPEWLFVTPWTAACEAVLSFTISWSLLELKSTESVMPPNRLILCRPLLLLPSMFPSIRVFSNESALHIKWPKYWSFSFSTSPSNQYLWLNSLLSKGLSKVFSSTTVWKYQFLGVLPSLLSPSWITPLWWQRGLHNPMKL